ncbi:BLUF domain-containing protein [Leucobacter sp. USCH14]|uniref:BLUF domain-containing protein n=1 Tax=Leucobacter sp. USCH14 TaxID=3024838 RepID=UPI0030B3F0FD
MERNVTSPEAGIRTSSEMVRSLVYTSVATRPFSDAELDALLEQARSRNAALQVTGMLSYRNGSFVQFLEGSEEHLAELMTDISADSRHTDVRVLIDEPIAERQFSSWTMGYQRMRTSGKPVPIGFRDTFTDLEQGADDATTARAARELALWFKVRSTS